MNRYYVYSSTSKIRSKSKVYFHVDDNYFYRYYLLFKDDDDEIEQIEIISTEHVPVITKCKIDPNIAYVDRVHTRSIQRTTVGEFRIDANLVKEIIRGYGLFSLLYHCTESSLKGDESFAKFCIENRPDTVYYFLEKESDTPFFPSLEREIEQALALFKRSYEQIIRKLDIINKMHRKYIRRDGFIDEIKIMHHVLYGRHNEVKIGTLDQLFLYLFKKIYSYMKCLTDFRIMYKNREMWAFEKQLDNFFFPGLIPLPERS